MKKTFFKKPESISELIVLLITAPIVLSSPYGARRISREFVKYLEDKLPDEESEGLQPGKISQALYRLRKRKIINIFEKDGLVHICLTEKGRKKKIATDLNKMNIQQPDAWDNKWRMVMFDIPEERKVARNALRDRLKQLGLFQFQKSVWIYPYDCRKEIDFVADFFDVGEYITILTAKIDDDKPLKEYFQVR